MESEIQFQQLTLEFDGTLKFTIVDNKPDAEFEGQTWIGEGDRHLENIDEFDGALKDSTIDDTL